MLTSIHKIILSLFYCPNLSVNGRAFIFVDSRASQNNSCAIWFNRNRGVSKEKGETCSQVRINKKRFYWLLKQNNAVSDLVARNMRQCIHMQINSSQFTCRQKLIHKRIQRDIQKDTTCHILNTYTLY